MEAAPNINPFTDFGFKKLFGEEASKDLLLDFINAVLEPETGPVASLEFSRNEHLGTGKLDRKVVFDIYCVSESGERFIVEMQKAFQLNLRDRSLYYATYPIQEQGKRGDWDFGLKAVYCISILDFVLDKEGDRYLHRVGLLDRETGEEFSDKLRFLYVEVPKFAKKESELETKFDKWLYVLKHLEYLERVPARIREKIFEKVMDIATIVNLEKKDRQQSLKQYRDLKNALDASKLEGRMEGEKLGMEKGEKLGIEKGKRSGVVNFYKEKVPISLIAKAMELEVSKVEDILREEGLL